MRTRTYRRPSRRIALAVIARTVSLAAAFGLSVIVARQLPVSQAGTFFVCIAVTTLVSTAARAGIDTFLLREISGAGVDEAELRRLLYVASALLFVAAMATGACAFPLRAGTRRPGTLRHRGLHRRDRVHDGAERDPGRHPASE